MYLTFFKAFIKQGKKYSRYYKLNLQDVNVSVQAKQKILVGFSNYRSDEFNGKVLN